MSDSHIRELMAQKRKLPGDSKSLGGKDKVKMLKMMKEIKRGEQKLQPSHASNVKRALYPTKMEETQTNQLPVGFFDDPKSTLPNSTSVYVHTEIAVSESNSKNVAQQADCLASANSLPQGFFDDPFEDSRARGVDLHKVLHKQEVVENETLSNFLEEIKESEEDIEKAEIQEEESKEYENEALHMSYLARYAGLLSKASGTMVEQQLLQGGNRTTLPSQDFVSEALEFAHAFVPTPDGDIMLPPSTEQTREEGTVGLLSGGNGNIGGVGNDASEVERILREKRRAARKEQKLLRNAEYLPLDMSNWTARSL